MRSDGLQRRAGVGPKPAQEGDDGTRRRAESTARSSAAGPAGRARAGEWDVGRKWPRATRTMTEMHFFLFSEAFEYEFV